MVTELSAQDANTQFAELSKRFLDEYPALSPVNATGLGDHRYDSLIDEISEAARDKERAFYQRWLTELANINRSQLNRDNQTDHVLLTRKLQNDLWFLDGLKEWEWNPIAYTQLAGGAIYSLMAREFAPIEKRLQSVTERLEKFPRMYEQIRATLKPARVPTVHAETAIKQNRGVLSTLDNMVRPERMRLTDAERQRLDKAMEIATAAVEQQQQWLEKDLLPNAKGDHRLGAKLYDEKLRRVLDSPLSRQELKQRAEFELQRVRTEMYALAVKALAQKKLGFTAPVQPTPEQKQTTIAAALELAYADVPPRDGVVLAAEKSLEITTAFVKSRDLMTLPPDPLKIIVMPEFQRGVAVAYCDSPGALEVGQQTFYAVAPLPTDWTD